MPTREQARAGFALAKVRVSSKDKDKDKYKTQLLKLPARLHANGLGQTVAFYLSAGPNKPETKICGWIEEWLRPEHANVYPSGQPLIDCITGGGHQPGDAEDAYRRASAEARLLALWLKRFAEAFIEGERV